MLKVNFFPIFLFFCILINFNLLALDCKKPQMPSVTKWQNWLSEIKKEALNLGISKKTINRSITPIKSCDILEKSIKTTSLNDKKYYL